MTRTEFFNQVAQSENPMLFSLEEHQKVRRLKARLGNLRGARVMEPGCGAGPLTEYLAKWVGDDGEVFAFDASPAMVEVCRRRMADRLNVRVECAMLGRIPLEAGAWDLIILFRVFPHLDDKEGVLKQLRIALKPLGKLAIVNLESSEVLNQWHSHCGGPVCRDYMPSATETEELLARCGYEVVKLEDGSEGFWAIARKCR